jgi:DNA modification methylase
MRNDLAIKTVPLDELHNAPWNANRVPDDVLAKIRHSIVEFGVVENLVARKRDEGGYEVISGNHRLGVYRDLGMKKASVHVVTLDDAKARVLAQVLNRTRGQDDAEEYAALLTEVLAEMDMDEVLSYLPESEKSLSQALDVIGLEDDDSVDQVPPLPDEPESKVGEVYEMGPHRLVCGDSTDPAVLFMLMQNEKASMMFTDPPYGVAYESSGRRERARQQGLSKDDVGIKPIANDAMTLGQTEALWVGAWTAARDYIEPGGAYYVSGPQGGELFIGLMGSLRDSGFPLRHTIIWAKDHFVMGRADYHYQHEPILYGWVDGTHSFYGDRSQVSLWQIPRPKRSDLHPTMKPVELVERAVQNSTKRGDIVLDPFGGSGTTLIAADRLGRRARLVELDPRYCDVIRQRYEQAHA